MFGKKPRIYHKDGKAYPSVTSVLSALDKSALIQWAANCAVDWIVTGADWSEPEKVNNPRWIVSELRLAEARTAYKRESMEAREYGTYIHTLCELHLTTKQMVSSPHKQTDKLMSSFYSWFTKHNVKPIKTEVVVFGDNYAGRVDLICEIDQFWYKSKDKKDQAAGRRKRVITLIDFKTGKGSYYPTWYLQTAAYANAYNLGLAQIAAESKEYTGLKEKVVECYGVLKFNKLTCRVNYKDFTPTYDRDLKAFKLIAEFYGLFVELK